MRTYLLLFCILTASCGNVDAPQLREIFAKSRTSTPQEIAEQWRALESLPGINRAALNYNLALSLWQVDQKGEAMYHLLKSEQLRPRDKAIDQLRASWEKELGLREASDSYSLGFLTLSVHEAWWASALGLWLIVTRRKALLILGVVLSLYALPQAILPSLQKTQAVVVMKPATLRELPVADLSGEALPWGDRVEILQSQGEFYRVQTPKGEAGWVLQREVKEL